MRDKILIVLIFAVCKISATNISSDEYYYPHEDNGVLAIKFAFEKLNTILTENREMKQYLINLNKRHEENFEKIDNVNDNINLKFRTVDERFQILQKQTEDIASSKRKCSEMCNLEEKLKKLDVINDNINFKFYDFNESLKLIQNQNQEIASVNKNLSEIYNFADNLIYNLKDDINHKYQDIGKSFKVLQNQTENIASNYGNLSEKCDLDGKLKQLDNINDNMNLKFQQVDNKFQILQKQNEDATLKYENIGERQETLIKKISEEIGFLKKSFSESLDFKSLNQNRDWTVIQRRQDGSVNFYRNWTEYKRGFGNPNGEFFIGLEKLHALTTYSGPQELLIIMEDFDNQTRYAKYDKFIIGSEAEKYSLKELGKYSGDAGDSLSDHKGDKFSTFDQDNDSSGRNCAKEWKGAWWFNKCLLSHLNGPFTQRSQVIGIKWSSFRPMLHSLKFTEMMIRPKA